MLYARHRWGHTAMHTTQFGKHGLLPCPLGTDRVTCTVHGRVQTAHFSRCDSHTHASSSGRCLPHAKAAAGREPLLVSIAASNERSDTQRVANGVQRLSLNPLQSRAAHADIDKPLLMLAGALHNALCSSNGKCIAHRSLLF